MPSKHNHLEHTTFAFLDIETTGGNLSRDRITEIGIRFWRAGEVVDEWKTLLNPDVRISPFIEKLTGISNTMVADAPSFASIAGTLEEKLRDTIFVAHNARFDYGFIKSEYRRLGLLFSARVLCTVKLSRCLYPEFRQHNMDALIERHGLAQVQRHRAMGDVAAMLEFFTHAVADKGVTTLEESIAALLQSPSIPSNLPLSTLKDLPQSPGVYRFYGENDALLYVGKSINIAQRVAAHFFSDHNSNKGMRISQSLHRVEYTETAGELGALLLELRQIKTLNPLFNRRSRAAKNLVSIELAANDSGYLQARLVRKIEPQRLASYFGLFRSKRDAERVLSGIAAKNDLCNQLLSLEPERDGPCFQRALGRCQGACEGTEDMTRYNLRMQIAFHQLRLRTWPWQGPVAIVEQRDDGAQADILVIYNWIHVATLHDEQELYDLSLRGQSVTFDLDSYKLLVKALMGSADQGHSLIELPAVSAPDVLMP